MATYWSETRQAGEEKRCELVIAGPLFSERISKDGLDKGIFKLIHLNFLEISKTCLKELPPEIGCLTNLTRGVFYYNDLQALPPEMCQLKKLKFLDVSHNSISELPNDMASLVEMQSLNVSCNKLSSLPDLSGMLKLVTLNIGGNSFEQFPNSVCSKDLTHFTDLIANNNTISEIPLEIENLACLKVLSLADNQISAIPGELGACTKLKELNLSGNGLKDKRLLKLVQQCHVKQIMEYVRSHCPRSDAKDDKQNKSKKKTKRNKKVSESEDIVDLLDEMRILHVEDETIKVITTPRVMDVRPYIVCCVAKDVKLKEGNMLKKFITLQTKLHESICEKRTAATIATHDLSKVQGNVLYDAREPKKIKILPLNKKKEVTALELYTHLNEEADMIRKEKKKNTYSGIHKYLYLLKDKSLYPCLVDSSGIVISFPPITNSDGSRISEDTKDVLLEVTGNNLNTCKKVMDTLLTEMLKLGIGDEASEDINGDDPHQQQHFLAVQQVKVVDEEGQLKVVYPSRTDIPMEGIVVNRV